MRNPDPKVHHRSTSAQPLKQPDISESSKSTMKDYDSSWLEMDDIDAINFRVEQLRALANAMYCVAYLDDDHRGRNYLNHSQYNGQPIAVETIAPLSLLSQRLCDEVDYHVHMLHSGRTEEKRKRLDPEGQAILDELAHILSVATPAEREILALGIEGVKQKAQQKEASHSLSEQGKKKLNGQGKG